MQEYELSIEIMAEVLDKLREQYPRLSNSFYAKNILKYLEHNTWMLNPNKYKSYSPKNYVTLNKKLSAFNQKHFIKRLLTKH